MLQQEPATEETKRLNKLEAIADKIKSGENVQKPLAPDVETAKNAAGKITIN